MRGEFSTLRTELWQLAEVVFLARPNPLNLVFVTKNGTPWDQNLIVKRTLHPLLESLRFGAAGCMHSATPMEA